MNERGIITGLLVRWLILLGVLGVGVVDAAGIIMTRVSVGSIATDVVQEAAATYGETSTGREKAARATCVRQAKAQSATCAKLWLDGEWIRVRVRKQAPSLLLRYVPMFKTWTRPVAEHSASVP